MEFLELAKNRYSERYFDSRPMLKGDMDAGINTVSSAASLIKSIDSCEEIVNEIARGYSN